MIKSEKSLGGFDVTKNELISEYMGKYTPHSIVPQMPIRDWKDWRNLMEVVDNIEDLGFEVIIAESRCKIKHNTDHSNQEVVSVDIIGTKKEATYQAVLEFINVDNSKNFIYSKRFLLK